jgi:hypothetical protein
MLLSHGSDEKVFRTGHLGENICIFRGQYTYLELGVIAFIGL